MWDGFWSEEDPPSPKSQSHELGFPPDRSVNCTVRGICPLTGAAEKSAESVPPTGARVVVTAGTAVVGRTAAVVTAGRVVVGGVEEPDPPFADSMGPATTYAPTTSTAITAIAAPIIHFGFPAGAGAGGGDGGETTRGGGGGGGAAAGAGSGPAPAGAPHCSQNFPPTGSGAPHFGQAREAGSDAPHFSQNRSASAAGAPQAGQTRVDETSTMKSLCTRLLPESIYTIPNALRRWESGSPPAG